MRLDEISEERQPQVTVRSLNSSSRIPLFFFLAADKHWLAVSRQ
jgi:hypothetical protein